MKLVELSLKIKMANQTVVLFAVLLITALVSTQPQLQSTPQPQVVREINNNDGSGNYLFTYVIMNKFFVLKKKSFREERK